MMGETAGENPPLHFAGAPGASSAAKIDVTLSCSALRLLMKPLIIADLDILMHCPGSGETVLRRRSAMARRGPASRSLGP